MTVFRRPTPLFKGSVARFYSSKTNVLLNKSLTGFESLEIDVSRHDSPDEISEFHGKSNEDFNSANFVMSKFRNPDGSLIKGETAEEARLHDWTLKGRVNRRNNTLPQSIAEVINLKILPKHPPSHLRIKAAKIFQSLSKNQIQQAPETSLECDAHIAATFLQDYSNARQVLLELRNRVGKEDFNPNRVLEIGYGPSTGMVALNEIMGPSWIPEVKDSYIIGRTLKMRDRAKIILLRQANENVQEVEVEVDEEGNIVQEVETEAFEDPVEEISEEDFELEMLELSAEEKEDILQQATASIQEIERHSGPKADKFKYSPVNPSQIKTYTKFRNHLPLNRMYDLIIVNQCLLKRVHLFPKDVDQNISKILRLLKPEGHIVFVERGNALGFEIVARARQVMIRPEDYEIENGKIPRPYFKASTIKAKSLTSDDLIITEADLQFEKELAKKYGEVSDEELKFEFENDGNFEIFDSKKEKLENTTEFLEEVVQTQSGVPEVPIDADFHLKILAPCSHHGKCPLQLGVPEMYRIPYYRNRLRFCSFHNTVQRPKYTMELKKGKHLATTWDKTLEDGFGLDRLTKDKLRKLQGTGRTGGNDYETGSYSYLIAERLKNDKETINKIQHKRKTQFDHVLDQTKIDNWPRILYQPVKAKKNVRLEVCAPSGNIELWDINKNLGKQDYHDARKAVRGDLWALNKKTVHVRRGLTEEKFQELKKTLRKTKKKLQKDERKRKLKLLIKAQQAQDLEDGLDPEQGFLAMADQVATELEMSNRYKQAGKKANFAVDPRDYDGL